MNGHQSTRVNFVSRPNSDRWASEVIPIHGEQQHSLSNTYTRTMPKNHPNYRPQPFSKQRMPNEHERPMSIVSLVSDRAMDSKYNTRHRYRNSKNDINQSKSLKDILISLQLFLTTLVALAALGMSIYLFVYLNQLARTTTMTTTTTTLTTTTIRPECSTYTTITDPTRRITTGGGTATDYGSFGATTTWVRFDGAAGTQIVTSPPSVSECYTYYTGWYTGSMPTDGNTASGAVCYVVTGNTCVFSNTISVTNCGSFYVYGLISPPVATYLRYCTN